MRKKIKIFAILLSVVFICLVGCENRRATENTSNKGIKEDTLYLYYINTDENAFYPVEYETEETETLKIAKEMLHKMSDSTNVNTDAYKLPISEDVSISTVTISENIISVNFDASYNQQTSKREILCRGAIVKTLMQIDRVSGVQFLVDGVSLAQDSVAVGSMTDDIFMDSEEDIYRSSEEVSLYYANEDGNKLIEIVQTVEAKDNISLEQAAIEALKKAPSDENVISPLPRELEIQKVQIYDNICYISLSDDVVNSVSNVKDEIMVYSMVNTIIGMGNVNSVQFTVNGEKVKSLHEYNTFDQVLTFNYNVCDYNN